MLEALLALSALALSACAGHSTASRAPCPPASATTTAAAPQVTTTAENPGTTGAPPAAVPGSPAPEPTRAPSPRDSAALEAWIEKSEDSRDLPVLVAHVFANAEARNVTLAVSYASGESAVQATATVTLDGLLDDSVLGEEHVLTFVRDAPGTPWRLERTATRVRCRQGRGHAELSALPCT